jgi:ribosomal protein S27E
VKVISKKKQKTQTFRVKCKECLAILEYTKEDISKITHSFEKKTVDCPECGNIIKHKKTNKHE